MIAIVAVYSDWGIGADGTQPIALSADRKYFREATKGACVIVGKRTMADFPGGRPLPKRVNLVMTRSDAEIPGAILVHSVEEALEAAKEYEKVMVIGGATVYKALLPYCDEALVTKVEAQPKSDVFFPNLDESPEWECADPGIRGEEEGIGYRFCRYIRRRNGD